MFTIIILLCSLIYTLASVSYMPIYVPIVMYGLRLFLVVLQELTMAEKGHPLLSTDFHSSPSDFYSSSSDFHSSPSDFQLQLQFFRLPRRAWRARVLTFTSYCRHVTREVCIRMRMHAHHVEDIGMLGLSVKLNLGIVQERPDNHWALTVHCVSLQYEQHQ